MRHREGTVSGHNVLAGPRAAHLVGSEVIALDAHWFEGLYRWQLSLAGAGDLGRFSFGFQVDRDEDPGYFASLFRWGTGAEPVSDWHRPHQPH